MFLFENVIFSFWEKKACGERWIAYSDSRQTSKRALFEKIVNGFYLLTVFVKNPHLLNMSVD